MFLVKIVQTICVSLCFLIIQISKFVWDIPKQIKTNDNELKIYFVMGAINHNFISRRSKSLNCCINHTLKIYNDVSPINQPLDLNESTVNHKILGEIPLSVSPFNSYWKQWLTYACVLKECLFWITSWSQ